MWLVVRWKIWEQTNKADLGVAAVIKHMEASEEMGETNYNNAKLKTVARNEEAE